MPNEENSDKLNSNSIALIGPDRAPIAISLSEYKGNRSLDIRRYYKKKGEDELLPTRKGIGLNANVLEPVLNSVSDKKDEILSWLKGGSDQVKASVERDLRDQLDAKNTIAREHRNFRIRDYQNKDQRFFTCSSEGANDIVSFNANHPFNDLIQEIAGQLVTGKNTSDLEAILRDLIGSLIISYSRASSRFSGDSELPANQLFEALEYEWGAILKHYSAQKMMD